MNEILNETDGFTKTEIERIEQLVDAVGNGALYIALSKDAKTGDAWCCS